MRVLLDEMYGQRLRDALIAVGIQATTVNDLGLDGSPDPDVFAAAVASDSALLTENVGDFTRISGEWSGAGKHHSGLLVALSSRFTRRPSGVSALVSAVQAAAGGPLDDRVVFLVHPA